MGIVCSADSDGFGNELSLLYLKLLLYFVSICVILRKLPSPVKKAEIFLQVCELKQCSTLTGPASTNTI